MNVLNWNQALSFCTGEGAEGEVVEQRRVTPPEIEELLNDILGRPPAEAALLVANIAHRATAALHGLANREAKSRKGTPDWGKWARLTNASRQAVLQMSTCRDVAREL